MPPILLLQGQPRAHLFTQHPMERTQAKWGKKKIGVGSMVTVKVGEIEEKANMGRSIRLSKEVMGCVQDVVGEKKFWVRLEAGKLKVRVLGSSRLSQLKRTKSRGTKRVQPKHQKSECESTIVYEDPVFDGVGMDREGMYFSFFYRLWFTEERSLDLCQRSSWGQRETRTLISTKK